LIIVLTFVFIHFISFAKVLLFCDIFVVLVGPFCSRVCAFRKIVVLLQRFSLGTNKTRTTGCHPVNEVVGYPCSRRINTVARFSI